jgi:ATP-dependent helicase/nuclease subunit A
VTSKRRQAADAVVALMSQHGLAPGDVMVLARKRAMLARVAQALAGAACPCGGRTAGAARSAEFAGPGGPAGCAGIARPRPGAGAGPAQPLAGRLRDDDLLWLAQATSRGRQPGWPPCWRRATPSPALARAQTPAGGLGALAAPELPPHDLLDRIVHEGDLLPRAGRHGAAARRAVAQQAVQALLAAALAHDSGRFATVYGFVRAVRAGPVKAPGVAPAAAVQLLTVHGAKGLEAARWCWSTPTRSRPSLNAATLLVDWPVAEPAPRRVAFVASQARLPPAWSTPGLLEEQARRAKRSTACTWR